MAELNNCEVRGERGRGIIEGSELPLLMQAAVRLTWLIVKLSLRVDLWMKKQKTHLLLRSRDFLYRALITVRDQDLLMTLFLKS